MKKIIKSDILFFLIALVFTYTIFPILSYFTNDLISLQGIYLHRLYLFELCFAILITLIAISSVFRFLNYELAIDILIKFNLFIMIAYTTIFYIRGNKLYEQGLSLGLILLFIYLFWVRFVFKRKVIHPVVKIVLVSILVLLLFDLVKINRVLKSLEKISNNISLNYIRNNNIENESVYLKTDTINLTQSIFPNDSSIDYTLIDPLLDLKIEFDDSLRSYDFFEINKRVHVYFYFKTGNSLPISKIQLIEKYYRDYYTWYSFDRLFYMKKKGSNQYILIKSDSLFSDHRNVDKQNYFSTLQY